MLALASVAQLVGALSCELEGLRFNSWSGYMPGWQVCSLVEVLERGSWSMFLSLCSSLLFSLKSRSMSLGGNKKKEKQACLLFIIEGFPEFRLSQNSRFLPDSGTCYMYKCHLTLFMFSCGNCGSENG